MEQYLSEGGAPEWSSTFQKVMLQSGAVPFRGKCSRVVNTMSSTPYKLYCSTFEHFHQLLFSIKGNLPSNALLGVILDVLLQFFLVVFFCHHVILDVVEELFSLGLNFSLQPKSWPKAEHYIHCFTHHDHPQPTHQKLFEGSRPSRRLISGIWTSQRSTNKTARFV